MKVTSKRGPRLVLQEDKSLTPQIQARCFFVDSFHPLFPPEHELSTGRSSSKLLVFKPSTAGHSAYQLCALSRLAARGSWQLRPEITPYSA